MDCQLTESKNTLHVSLGLGASLNVRDRLFSYVRDWSLITGRWAAKRRMGWGVVVVVEQAKFYAYNPPKKRGGAEKF